MKRLLLAFLLSAACHAQSPWTKADTAREALSVGMLAADWGQTLNIQEHPMTYIDLHNGTTKWQENIEENPLLGRHPSRATINTYFVTSIGLHVLIARLLPEHWRHAFQYITIGFEGGVVARNCKLGFRVSF